MNAQQFTQRGVVLDVVVREDRANVCPNSGREGVERDGGRLQQVRCRSRELVIEARKVRLGLHHLFLCSSLSETERRGSGNGEDADHCQQCQQNHAANKSILLHWLIPLGGDLGRNFARLQAAPARNRRNPEFRTTNRIAGLDAWINRNLHDSLSAYPAMYRWLLSNATGIRVCRS